MKKRFSKIRKKIKHPVVRGGSWGDIRGKNKRGKKPEGGGALVPYEKGEIWETEQEAERAVTARNEGGEREDDTENISREKCGGAVRLICSLAVVFSLLGAALILCFSFAAVTEYSHGDTGSPIDSGAETGEDHKVIFVQTDGHTNGLSAPEIYEKCAKTAVSICVSFTNGGEGIGSGFIFSKDGYVATAAHVIADADRISVLLYNGREYEAEVIGADPLSDVALLKIDNAAALPVAELGSSASIVVGERVYAIGTPAHTDYASSLSSGEISAPIRSVPVYRDGVALLEKRLKAIQINAQVNKGNSGCPLFDPFGRVVGMVTMRLGDGYQGMGFALPIDGVAAVLGAMREGRELDREVLAGIVELPARLGIGGYADQEDGIYGLRVSTVTEDTDASGALKLGDLIVQIDNRLVTSPSDISAVTERKKAGDKVRITLIRSGQRLTYDIALDD